MNSFTTNEIDHTLASANTFETNFRSIWPFVNRRGQESCCTQAFCLFYISGNTNALDSTRVRWPARVLDILNYGASEELELKMSCGHTSHICCAYETIRCRKIESLLHSGNHLFSSSSEGSSGAQVEEVRSRRILQTEWYWSTMPVGCCVGYNEHNCLPPNGFMEIVTELVPTRLELQSVRNDSLITCSDAVIQTIADRFS